MQVKEQMKTVRRVKVRSLFTHRQPYDGFLKQLGFGIIYPYLPAVTLVYSIFLDLAFPDYFHCFEPYRAT